MSLRKKLSKIAELYYKKEDKINKETSPLRIIHHSKSKGDDEFGYYNNWLL